MTDDEFEALWRRLGQLMPAGAVRRGWNLQNLGRVRTASRWGDDDAWTVELVGPDSIDVQAVRTFAGVQGTTFRILTGVVGTLWSPTADGLETMVREAIEVLGLAEFKL